MARKKGAEYIVDMLIREKIDHVFGICGHGNVGLLDELYTARDKIRLISPRHEQTASHMADAYFRVKHNPAATLTSCGPGSANLVMALAVAQTDSSAFLAMTANVPTSQFNRSPFQEVNRHYQADFPNIIRPVVKRAFQPTRVEQLPLMMMRQAVSTMTSGRPGPVNVDIPFDLFQEEAEIDSEPAWNGFNVRRSGAAPEDIKATVDMLLAAQRPVLFVGHGVTLSEASAELTALAHWLCVPVISSPNGMGTIDMVDELSLGFIGRNGAFPANQAGRYTDLVAAVGGRFDDRSSSSWLPGYSWNFPTSKLVHVDVDHGELGRNYVPDLAILADARTFLRQLLSELQTRSVRQGGHHRAWHEQIAIWRKEWHADTQPSFDLHTSPIRPERVVADLRGGYGEIAGRIDPGLYDRVTRGEAPITERPGALVPPALKRIRAARGPFASDDDLLLAAFYDDTQYRALKGAGAINTDYPLMETPLKTLVKELAERPTIKSFRLSMPG